MSIRIKSALCAVAIAAALAGPVHAEVIVSDFAVNEEGWLMADMGPGGINPPNIFFPATFYDATGRFIHSADVLPWNSFFAPVKFRGDKSAFFGGRVSYDLMDTLNDGVEYVNILITSVSGKIYIDTLPPSTTAFTHYEFVLDESGPWLDGLGSAATNAQIQAVLANITGIYVDADWHTGVEEDARLDNFLLQTANGNNVPEPVSVALISLGLGALGLTRRRRREQPIV